MIPGAERKSDCQRGMGNLPAASGHGGATRPRRCATPARPRLLQRGRDRGGASGERANRTPSSTSVAGRRATVLRSCSTAMPRFQMRRSRPSFRTARARHFFESCSTVEVPRSCRQRSAWPTRARDSCRWRSARRRANRSRDRSAARDDSDQRRTARKRPRTSTSTEVATTRRRSRPCTSSCGRVISFASTCTTPIARGCGPGIATRDSPRRACRASSSRQRTASS